MESSETPDPHFFDTLLVWNKVSDTSAEYNYVVYASENNQTGSFGKLLSWQSFGAFIDKLPFDT